MEVFIYILFIIALVVVIFTVGNSMSNKSEIENARDIYQNNLTRLTEDPTNSTLKMQTLESGRSYSNLTRNKNGISLFDEVALMNDINAACAGATVVKNETSNDSQKCPHCAELIKKRCKICRYCQRDIPSIS